jgi:hypothetical protein
LFAVAGNLVGIDPAVMDNIDIDYAIDKYSSLMNNDPRIIRAPTELAVIRKQRQDQQAQDQAAARAEQLAKAGQTLSQTDVGGGQNALQKMTGVLP